MAAAGYLLFFFFFFQAWSQVSTRFIYFTRGSPKPRGLYVNLYSQRHTADQFGDQSWSKCRTRNTGPTNCHPEEWSTVARRLRRQSGEHRVFRSASQVVG